MSRKPGKGETQKERRTRNKRRAYARGLYAHHNGIPKNVSRALRRHPPTTCLACHVELTWDIPSGQYVDPLNVIAGCRPGDRHHHQPANGRRGHRYVDGNEPPVRPQVDQT